MPATEDGTRYTTLLDRESPNRPWKVRWNPRRYGATGISRGFATEAERDRYIADGLPEDVELCYAGPGRRTNDRERELRGDPGNWEDELREVMGGVYEYRKTRTAHQPNLLSDVYHVMKKMGFRKGEPWPS